MPFAEDCEVWVKELTEKDWEVLKEITYRGKIDSFTVPIEMETDFASVPRPLVWLIPQYGQYTRAAIVHDYLWRYKFPAGEITLAEADAIFRRAMRELGVPFLRRWLMWAAVRVGALKKAGGRRQWLRDSWQVVPLAVLALPIVALPAIVILVALGVFYVIEWTIYLPLKLTKRVKERCAEVAKEVNAPKLDIKLS